MFKKFIILSVFFLYGALMPQSFSTLVKDALPGITYILCFDGGGSKTNLQILDTTGTILYEGNGDGSNINVMGFEAVKTGLSTMLHGITLHHDTSLDSVKAQCLVVGGFSGAAREEPANKLKDIFSSLGFPKDKIFILGDAAMCLESIDEPGIIVIAGTGVISFGKNDGVTYRVGGFGWRVDKGGSGYHFGMAALRAALAEEYGCGMHTPLTDRIKKHFEAKEVKKLIGPLNALNSADTMMPKQIAALAPFVFETATAGDFVAQEIINEQSIHLGKLLKTMVAIGHFSPCSIHFFGGIFKCSIAQEFITSILNTADLDLATWQTSNDAAINPSTRVVQKCSNKNNNAFLTKH